MHAKRPNEAASSGLTPERVRARGDQLAELLVGLQNPPGLIPPLPGVQHEGADAWSMNDLRRVLDQQSALLARMLDIQEHLAHASPSVVQAPTPAAMDTDGVSGSNPSYKMSGIIGKKLTAEAAKVKKSIHNISLSKSRIDKFTEMLESLSAGKTPAGIKPFKVYWTGKEWSSTVDEEDLSSLIVPAKKTDTLEEVANQLHIEFNASRLVLQRLAESRRLAELIEGASLVAFLSECTAIAATEKAAFMNSCPSDVLSKEVWAKFEKDVEDEGRRLYILQVKKVAMEQMVTDDKKQKQASREAKALELASLLPRGVGQEERQVQLRCLPSCGQLCQALACRH